MPEDPGYLDWLRSIGIPPPAGLTEERCRSLALPPSGMHARRGDTRKIVVHHSATATGSAAHFRVLHRGVNRWDDVGYHWIIGNGYSGPDGLLETGRPGWARGAHAKGFNDISIGVCLVGDFTDCEPTGAQQDSLVGLLRRLLEEYGLGAGDILLHREVPGCRTECPGTRFPCSLLGRLAVI